MATYYSQHNNAHGVKGFEISSPSLKQYTFTTVCSPFNWPDKGFGFKTKYVDNLFFNLHK